MNRIAFVAALCAAIGVCLLGGAASGDVPRLIGYQGKITDAGGTPAPGPVNLTIRLYNASAGGAVLFGPEIHNGVVLSSGVFTVHIGGQTVGGVPDSGLNATEVWLGVQVNAAAELPRVRLVMAPYAAKSRSAERLVLPDTFTAAASVSSSGNIDLPTARLIFGSGTTPLISAGHNNTVGYEKRMWITHSELTPAVGIQYRDLSSDGQLAESLEFVLGDQTKPRMSYQLNPSNLLIFDGSGNKSLALNSNTVGTAGEISMLAPDGTTETVEIAAAASSTTGSQIKLGKQDGEATITLDAEYLAGAPMVTLSDGAQNNLLLSGATGGVIVFGPGTADPLITAGHNNTVGFEKRMWIGHSTGSKNWGIQYRDLASDGWSADAIEFVAGDQTKPRFRAELSTGTVSLADSAGHQAIQLIPSGVGSAGEVSLYDYAADTKTVEIIGADSSTAGGQIMMREADGSNSIEIDGQYSTAGGGFVRLYKADGTTAITLQADVSGDGRITTQELSITGGSDLSEQFDVGTTSVAPKPGLLVCIDPARPGKLVVSAKPYDRTVAGVLSGAGGVKPGMMMGQEGSVADGQHPVALSGRVYCWCDASQGVIVPGDLLTTSSTPGHAMRVRDHRRAQGAAIGKAMTGLAKGKGLVLTLVSLH